MGCLPPPSRIGCVSPRAVDGDLIPKRGIGLERWSKHPTRTIIIITIIIIIIIIIINMVKKTKKTLTKPIHEHLKKKLTLSSWNVERFHGYFQV
jgi:hypothetical protein